VQFLVDRVALGQVYLLSMFVNIIVRYTHSTLVMSVNILCVPISVTCPVQLRSYGVLY